MRKMRGRVSMMSNLYAAKKKILAGRENSWGKFPASEGPYLPDFKPPLFIGQSIASGNAMGPLFLPHVLPHITVKQREKRSVTNR